MTPKPKKAAASNGWAIYTPEGNLCFFSIAVSYQKATDNIEAIMRTPFRKLRQLGYRCAPIAITPRQKRRKK